MKFSFDTFRSQFGLPLFPSSQLLSFFVSFNSLFVLSKVCVSDEIFTQTGLECIPSDDVVDYDFSNNYSIILQRVTFVCGD